ncbi:uncharacterized protein [Watersipora subatra]|uniref:uncharacterized protein n=1 Tax=Watersipora subatra TaxID=2589382 RepID=UPI00355B6483
MADLDRVAMPPRRPKTAINLSNKELLVPQPYIYRSASFAARKASQKSARSAVQPQPVTFTDEVFGMFAEKNRSLNTSPDQTSNKLGTVVTPLSPSTADILGRPDRVMPIMKKTLVRKDSASSSSDPLVPKINIAIETDDGAPQPLEIDGIEAFRNENSNMEDEKSKDTDIRKHSIAERMQKIKLGEDVANNIKIEAAQRKKALEELLTEHEHLVKQTVSTDSGQQVVSPELAG